MRFLIYHIKDSEGNLLDYMTGEKKLGLLIAKHEIVKGYLEKQGFTLLKENVPQVVQKPLESTTQSQERLCAVCGKALIYKEGVNKVGKPYKGWFCIERDHPVVWVK